MQDYCPTHEFYCCRCGQPDRRMEIVGLLCAGWALAVVTSRAFRVAGPSQPASMLPLIDMCNHSFAPNCKIQTTGSGDVQLVALQHIPQQQPLQLSYGNLSNDFLLMDYGFVMPGNPFDRVQLSFSLELLEVQHHLQDSSKPAHIFPDHDLKGRS